MRAHPQVYQFFTCCALLQVLGQFHHPQSSPSEEQVLCWSVPQPWQGKLSQRLPPSEMVQSKPVPAKLHQRPGCLLAKGGRVYCQQGDTLHMEGSADTQRDLCRCTSRGPFAVSMKSRRGGLVQSHVCCASGSGRRWRARGIERFGLARLRYLGLRHTLGKQPRPTQSNMRQRAVIAPSPFPLKAWWVYPHPQQSSEHPSSYRPAAQPQPGSGPAQARKPRQVSGQTAWELSPLRAGSAGQRGQVLVGWDRLPARKQQCGDEHRHGIAMDSAMAMGHLPP